MKDNFVTHCVDSYKIIKVCYELFMSVYKLAMSPSILNGLKCLSVPSLTHTLVV